MTFAFTEAEHRTRIERARQTLAEKRLDGAICVAPEHIFCFGGYDAHTHFSEQALVFSVDDDEPTFIMRDADRACATETSRVEDVRCYHFGARATLSGLHVSQRPPGGAFAAVSVSVRGRPGITANAR